MRKQSSNSKNRFTRPLKITVKSLLFMRPEWSARLNISTARCNFFTYVVVFLNAATS